MKHPKKSHPKNVVWAMTGPLSFSNILADIQKNSRALELEGDVTRRIGSLGFRCLGWFFDLDSRPTLLIGSVGGSEWASFSCSSFFSDNEPDPLNRWTRHHLSSVADDMNAEAFFPFGESVHPFQQWAKLATGMTSSPIGILIHPEYGLWVALRGALCFSEQFEIPTPPPTESPCLSCELRPCLTTCPVSAFGESTGYDVSACRSHIRSSSGSVCREGGCLARLSCPIGTNYAYTGEQQKFLMSAFLDLDI